MSGAAPTAPASAEESRADRTRARALDAAIEVFAERGFEGATMRHVAERSGVKTPLLVYHFASKEKLWQAAVDAVWARFEATLEDHARSAGLDLEALEACGGPRGAAEGRRVLGVVLRSFLQSVAEHPQYLRILLREGSHRSPRSDWLVEQHTRAHYEDGVRLLERCQRAGLLPEVPAHHLLYILSGAAAFVVAVEENVRSHTGLHPRSEPFLDAHAEALMALLLPEAR